MKLNKIKFYDEDLLEKIHFGMHNFNFNVKGELPYLNHSYRVYHLFNTPTGGSSHAKVIALSWMEYSELNDRTGEEIIRGELECLFSNRLNIYIVKSYNETLFNQMRWIFQQLNKRHTLLKELYPDENYFLPPVELIFVANRTEKSGLRLDMISIKPVLYEIKLSDGSYKRLHKWYKASDLFSPVQDLSNLVFDLTKREVLDSVQNSSSTSSVVNEDDREE